MWRFLLLCGLMAACQAQSIEYNSTDVQQCTFYSGELPLNVYIEGCETPPCLLPQLQDAVLHTVFRAPRLLRTLSTRAAAFMVSFIPIPYGLEEQAFACNFLGNTYCPILEGEVVEYTLRMFIQPFFPIGTQVPIEFRVLDEADQMVFCFRVVIRITEAIEGAAQSSKPALD